MTGEWVKWEKGLARKPKVIKMAGALGIDRFSVASRLMLVWEWADENILKGDITPEGSAFVTLSSSDDDNRAFIDAIAEAKGFADSMASIGWIYFRNGRIEFPKFNTHNGETGKTRARNAKNQNGKRKRDSNASRLDEPQQYVTDPQSKMSPPRGDILVTRERERVDTKNNTHSARGDPEEIDWITAESEFSKLWNKCKAVTGPVGSSLPNDLRRDFRLSWDDPEWRDVMLRALERIKKPFPGGERINLKHFLKQSTLKDLAEGTHGWLGTKQAGLPGSGRSTGQRANSPVSAGVEADYADFNATIAGSGADG